MNYVIELSDALITEALWPPTLSGRVYKKT